MKRILRISLVFLLLSGSSFSPSFGFAKTATLENNAKQQLNKTLELFVQSNPAPSISIIGGEWTILSLARSEYSVPTNYYQGYYERVLETVQKNQGILSTNKYTEYARVTLALTTLGKNPQNVGSYDVLSPLLNETKVTRQGINGPIWALIALGSKNTAEANKIKEHYIQYILGKEIKTGGFALSGTTMDADITSMALYALAPYRTNQAIENAIQRSLKALSENQNAQGGFSSWGVANSQSNAQVLIALTSLGIDPTKDARFAKGEQNPLTALLSYAIAGGGFKHLPGGGIDFMASEQAALALSSYQRFLEQKSPLFDLREFSSQEDEKIPPKKGEEGNKKEPALTITHTKIPKALGKSGETSKHELQAKANNNAKISYQIIQNKEIGKVSTTGKVEAKGKTGTFTVRITAKTNAGKEKTKDILYQVIDQVTSISVENQTLAKGNTLTLPVKVFSEKIVLPAPNVTYATSDKKTVSISKKGALKGLKSGTAQVTITAKTLDGSTEQKKIQISVQEKEKPRNFLEKKTASPSKKQNQKAKATVEKVSIQTKELKERGQKRVQITLTGDLENARVSYKGKTLYHSPELSQKQNQFIYLLLVDMQEKEEALSLRSNYTIQPNTQAEHLLFGDSNGDEKINAQDILTLLAISKGRHAIKEDKEWLACDLNADGKIDEADVEKLQKKFLQQEE